MGLYFLSKLAQASKAEPPILMDYKPARAARLAREGFVVEEGGRSTRIAGRSFIASDKAVEIDVAVLAVKSAAVRPALKKIKKALKKDGVILALQNGTAHLRALPERQTVFGLFLAGCDKQEDNRVSVFREEGSPAVAFAPNGKNPAASQKIEAMLEAGGIPYKILQSTPENILWTKSLYNAALNPVSAVLMKKNGELLESGAAKDLIQSAFEEGRSILRAAGRGFAFPSENPQEFPWSMLARTAGNRSSMFQDLAAGRKTEIDEILKPFLIEAKKRKLACPVLNSLYAIVKEYEKIRASLARVK